MITPAAVGCKRVLDGDPGQAQMSQVVRMSRARRNKTPSCDAARIFSRRRSERPIRPSRTSDTSPSASKTGHAPRPCQNSTASLENPPAEMNSPCGPRLCCDTFVIKKLSSLFDTRSFVHLASSK